jgi:hypothetical protein
MDFLFARRVLPSIAPMVGLTVHLSALDAADSSMQHENLMVVPSSGAGLALEVEGAPVTRSEPRIHMAVSRTVHCPRHPAPSHTGIAAEVCDPHSWTWLIRCACSKVWLAFFEAGPRQRARVFGFRFLSSGIGLLPSTVAGCGHPGPDLGREILAVSCEGSSWFRRECRFSWSESLRSRAQDSRSPRAAAGRDLRCRGRYRANPVSTQRSRQAGFIICGIYLTKGEFAGGMVSLLVGKDLSEVNVQVH